VICQTSLQSSLAVVTQALVNRTVTDMLERIFRKHGAVHVGVPLLMPKCALYDANDAYVCLMDRSGGLVGLPYDSRVNVLMTYHSTLCFIENRTPKAGRHKFIKISSP